MVHNEVRKEGHAMRRMMFMLGVVGGTADSLSSVVACRSYRKGEYMRSIITAIVGGSLLVSSIVTSIADNTPEGVVKAYYTACNEGKYSESASYLTSELLQVIKSPMGVAKDLLRVHCDSQTKNGTMDRIDNIKAEVRGEGAEVTFTLIYKDGSSKDDSESLFKQAGVW
jgi:hypothetical protein